MNEKEEESAHLSTSYTFFVSTGYENISIPFLFSLSPFVAKRIMKM